MEVTTDGEQCRHLEGFEVGAVSKLHFDVPARGVNQLIGSPVEVV
jgi:hypothetical protein